MDQECWRGFWRFELNVGSIIEYSVSKDSNNIYAKIFSSSAIAATALEIAQEGKVKHNGEGGG